MRGKFLQISYIKFRKYIYCGISKGTRKNIPGMGGTLTWEIIVFPPTQFIKYTRIAITYTYNGIMDRAQYSIFQRPWCVTNPITTHSHVNLQRVMKPKANKWACCYSYNIYRAYTKCLKKCQERVPHTKTRGKVHFNIQGVTGGMCQTSGGCSLC
jgi:hypothetical protein